MAGVEDFTAGAIDETAHCGFFFDAEDGRILEPCLLPAEAAAAARRAASSFWEECSSVVSCAIRFALVSAKQFRDSMLGKKAVTGGVEEDIRGSKNSSNKYLRR